MNEPTANPWDPMEGEPARWFARFDAYRLAGPSRSVNAVWQAENVGKGRKVSGVWYEMAERWKWEERARAWDAAQRAREEADLERQRQQRAKDLDAVHQKHAGVACEAFDKWRKMIDSIKPEVATIAEAVRFGEFIVALEKSSLAEPALVALEAKLAELQRLIAAQRGESK